MTAYYEPSNLDRANDRANGARANGDRDGERAADTNGAIAGETEMRDFRAALMSLKEELERSGRPDRFVMEKMERVEELSHHALPALERALTGGDGLDAATRSQAQALARQLRQSAEREEALQTAVRQVQGALQCDRVVVFEFDGVRGASPQENREGRVVAEFMTYGWSAIRGVRAASPDENRLPADLFGSERAGDYLDRAVVAIADSDDAPRPRRSLMDRFQVRASAAVPLIVNRQVWGLLVAQHCATPRRWEESELGFLDRAAAELALTLQSFQGSSDDSAASAALDRLEQTLRDAIDPMALLERVGDDLRQQFGLDRVAFYRFGADWSGEFVAESLGEGWRSLVGATVKDSHFQRMQGGRYAKGESLAVADVYRAGQDPCHVQLLEQFQIKAYVAVPVMAGGRLWGLMMACQQSSPRDWEAPARRAFERVAFQLGLALQRQAEAQRERVKQMAESFRQSRDLDALLAAATRDLRQMLGVDRVSVYRFGLDWSGDYVAESVGSGWAPLVGNSTPDGHFKEMKGGRYADGEIAAVSDAATADLPPCLLPLLEKIQAKAYVTAPIWRQDTLWGLLTVYQNDRPRAWEVGETEAVAEAGRLLGQAIARQEQAEREKLPALAERLNQARDFENLYAIATQEARQLLRADRLALYRFGADWSGDFIAEAMGSGWKPLVGHSSPDERFHAMKGGRYVQGDTLAVSDIYSAGLDPRHVGLLEDAQAKAYLSVPVFRQERLWGLAIAYQNDRPRCWSDFDREVLQTLADRLGTAIAARQQAERETLADIVQKMRAADSLQALYDTVTRELRQLLQLDRVAVYRFNADWSGDFAAESVGRNWVKLVGNSVIDDYFKGLQGGRYVRRETFVVSDVERADLHPEHRELLERVQAQAYVSAPAFAQEKLWGLLIAYQNGSPRQWDPWEVEAVSELAAQLGAIAQQVDSIERLQQQVARQRAVATIVDKIHQFLDLDTIMQTTANELRILMKLDRAAVYRFNPDWSGDFVSESVSEGWRPLLGRTIRDTYFERTKGGRYVNGETLVVADVYEEDYDPCHLELLKDFQCRAYIITPVIANDKLWGLLATYQNSGVRHWEPEEVDLTVQMGTQMGVAVQQAEYLNRLQTQANRLQKAADRDRAISSTIDKIRASLDIATIFRTTTTEVRQLLEADRVGIYKFEPDWSGEFIAESVGSGWTRLVSEQTDGSLRDNISNCESMNRLREGKTSRVDDTFLRETQGGRYREGQSFAVSDVYQAGFSPCYLNVLERFQAKAYAIAPIFKGEQLWGLLAVYQNSGPRQWDESEVDFTVQVGAQLGIALKQAEAVEALQQQSAQLEEASRRDKAAKEDLQHKVLQLLVAVRPALEGDLTVRAPITEDEVGTIADAYNNTLQSLRQIVLQLQSTAAKVSGTSQTSSESMAELSAKAQEQSAALRQALEQLKAMVAVTDSVRANAQQVNETVRQANDTVLSGDTAMNRTVDAILAIRDTVAETGRKIRSLSESSQKISKIVNLIGNFTTQTQLLALNAAIEATRAGEYGRGFTVVADEVRSLARQSADATTEIEALVAEIQAETNEVAEAMEAGIQQVAEGTTLVSDTRSSLNEIVQATTQIGELVQGIAQAAASQTDQSQSVTQTMSDVAAIADQTSKASVDLSASFEELLNIARELQASVGQFKVQ